MASESLKIAKLNGTNYQSWKFNIRCALMERGLWGYVRTENAIIKPEVKVVSETVTAADVAESKEKLNDYLLKADKAYSVIALSVENDLQIHVSSKNTAREAWDALREHFEFVSVTQIVRLYKRFYAAKMEENGDLLKHITEMTSLAEQIKEMKEEISSKKFAIIMLASLPESYDNFLTSLNARNADELDWSIIKGPLTEEYMKRKDKEKQKSDEEALFTRYDGNRGGYDQSMRGRGRSRGGGAGAPRRGGGRSNFHPYNSNNNRFNNKTCFNCNQQGHIAAVCPRNNQDEEASLAIDEIVHESEIALLTVCDDIEESQSDSSVHDVDDIAIISSETNNLNLELVSIDKAEIEVEEEIALISNVMETEEISHEWCIDSGASKHMTNDETLLSEIKYYDKPRPVVLGDKSAVMSHGEGKLRLKALHPSNTYISLERVLFVPKLMKNLLSVRTMTNLGAEVRFAGDQCLVIKHGQTVEIGRSVDGGLYKLFSPVISPQSESAYFAKTEAPVSTWHQRYGHLNTKDLNNICKMI